MVDVHIFWDGNNILGGAERAAEEQFGEPGFPRVRVYFRNLVDLIAKGRPVAQGWVAGNIPPPEDEVWAYLRGLGMETLLSRRTDDGKEGLMDDTLREKMLMADFDYPEKGVIALLTSDGAGHYQGLGFFANLKRLHARGWGVELYAWDCQVNKAMREWVKANGRYTALEDFYHSITFLVPDKGGNGARIVRPLPRLLDMGLAR